MLLRGQIMFSYVVICQKASTVPPAATETCLLLHCGCLTIKALLSGVVRPLILPCCTCVFWETDGEGAASNLLLKEILLVEEEDDGGLSEPLVVADGVKQLHALMHSVLKRSKIGRGLRPPLKHNNTSERPPGEDVG